uniref:Uncharacterized protein n=1 Tax=Micrurus corallinus TaxID=54390 RepID=A0A2D4GJQ6_MICCO
MKFILIFLSFCFLLRMNDGSRQLKNKPLTLILVNSDQRSFASVLIFPRWRMCEISQKTFSRSHLGYPFGYSCIGSCSRRKNLVISVPVDQFSVIWISSSSGIYNFLEQMKNLTPGDDVQKSLVRTRSAGENPNKS